MTRRILLALGIDGMLSSHAFGQQQAGQISGVVTDSTGAVTPGAKVTAIEVGTGFVRTTVAGTEGEYVLNSLRPTEYEITAEHAGFRTFRRTGIELLANQSLTVFIKLELGAVTETVSVSGAAVQVNTSTSTLSEVIDRARILEMPLNGRDVARLAAGIPGMSIISVSAESGK